MAAQENAPKRTRSNAKSVLTDLYIEVDDLMLRKKQDYVQQGKHIGGDVNDVTSFIEACDQVKRLIRERM